MPRSKFIWTNTYKKNNWKFTGTALRYGGVTEHSSTSYLNDDIYPAKWIFNAAVDYYRDRWTFTLGADNTFDTYPQLAPEGSNFHGIFRYPSSSPFGSQGAFVYRSEEHTSELQSLMRISYAVFCLQKKNKSSNV